MVRFAPQLAQHLLVREAITLEDEYRPAASSTPTPDPFEDADALEDLGDEIATLAAHIHAATQRLLLLIAEFDRRRGWELGGHRSCAYWLTARTGIDLGAAREKVRTARALVGLPETSASMARGELSFSQVRALSRVATEDNEGELLEFARGCTTAQLERMVRGFRRGSRQDEAERERRHHESRTFSVFPDEDGMYVVTGRLPAELGAVVMRAVEAASDALYRERGRELMLTEAERLKVAAQRRADALGLLAERALEAGFGKGESETGENGGPGGEGEDGDAVEPGADSGPEGRDPSGENDSDREAEPGGRNDPTDPAPISGTRAERFQVVLHVEPETLRSEGDPGRSELEDGTRVSAEPSGLEGESEACLDGVPRDRRAKRRRTVPAALL